jgi:hypothetical protein
MGEQRSNCTPCDRAKILGTSIRICQRSKGKDSCKALLRRAMKDDISPKEMIDAVKNKIKGDKKAEAALHEVELFLKRIRAEKS